MPTRNLRDGVIIIADAGGTGGGNTVTVDLEDGGLSYEEQHPITVIKDRGILDHARLADEEPVTGEITMKFQTLSTHAATTPYDAVTFSGGAAAWVSDEPTSDVNAVIIELTIDGTAIGGTDEVLTFARAAITNIRFGEGAEFSTLAFSFTAMITSPAIS